MVTLKVFCGLVRVVRSECAWFPVLCNLWLPGVSEREGIKQAEDPVTSVGLVMCLDLTA